MRKICLSAALTACLAIPAVAQADDDKSRGELLYATHCIACHNEKIHWREKKIARDWAGLKAQVNRWQGISGLGWSDTDIVEVAHYLNVRHYHYPERFR